MKVHNKKEALKKAVKKVGKNTLSNVIVETLKKISDKSKSFTTVNYVLKADIGKNGFFGSNYYLEGVLATSNFDLEGQKFDPLFLKSIAENYSVIEGYFTDEHFTSGIPDFFAKELRYENGVLKAKIYFNEQKSDFKSLVKTFKDKSKSFGLSIGVKNAVLTDDLSTIVNGEVVEFIVTRIPANPDNKIILKK